MVNEKGVSPVIGVILMVAITVILAAVIASFVFGMGSTVKKTYLVSATAAETNCQPGGTCDIEIVYQGGPDHPAVNALRVTAPPNCDNDFTSTDVGSKATCTGAGSAGDRNVRVIVVADFNDGTSQVILDTYV